VWLVFSRFNIHSEQRTLTVDTVYSTSLIPSSCDWASLRWQMFPFSISGLGTTMQIGLVDRPPGTTLHVSRQTSRNPGSENSKSINTGTNFNWQPLSLFTQSRLMAGYAQLPESGYMFYFMYCDIRLLLAIYGEGSENIFIRFADKRHFDLSAPIPVSSACRR